VDKLTSKKYAKTINLLCAGNKVLENIKLKGGVNPKTPSPCVRPCSRMKQHKNKRRL